MLRMNLAMENFESFVANNEASTPFSISASLSRFLAERNTYAIPNIVAKSDTKMITGSMLNIKVIKDFNVIDYRFQTEVTKNLKI